MPHTWSLDSTGPLTRRVEDAALTLRVIAGSDPRDPGSADMPVGDYRASLKKGIRGLRVGVPSEHFWDRIESRVEPVVRQALRDLEGAGARVEEVSIPHMAGALGAILVTEMASVTAWHDTYLRQPDGVPGTPQRCAPSWTPGSSSSPPTSSRPSACAGC